MRRFFIFMLLGPIVGTLVTTLIVSPVSTWMTGRPGLNVAESLYLTVFALPPVLVLPVRLERRAAHGGMAVSSAGLMACLARGLIGAISAALCSWLSRDDQHERELRVSGGINPASHQRGETPWDSAVERCFGYWAFRCPSFCCSRYSGAETSAAFSSRGVAHGRSPGVNRGFFLFTVRPRINGPWTRRPAEGLRPAGGGRSDS